MKEEKQTKRRKKKQVSFNVSMCQDQLLVDTISSSTNPSKKLINLLVSDP